VDDININSTQYKTVLTWFSVYIAARLYTTTTTTAMDSYTGLGMADGGSDNISVIHQDSDNNDNPEHDDDVDIGFCRHQYETFDDDRPKRPRSNDEGIYGVFMEDDNDNYLKKMKER
jgi:hypothetical protein